MPTNEGFFDLVATICESPSPSLDKNKYPSDLCDFIDLCLIKNPEKRATATTLLNHPFVTNRYSDRDEYLTQRSRESQSRMKRSVQARTIAFRKICAAVLRRHISCTMRQYEENYFNDDDVKKSDDVVWKSKFAEEKEIETKGDRRSTTTTTTNYIGFTAPLPRFDYGLVMGLAEQLELSAASCFELANEEWELALIELNLRLERRLEMVESGERPRFSSFQLSRGKINSLPGVKTVGTPAHMK